MEPEQKTDSKPATDTPVTVEKNTLMAILSYVSILVIIPILTARDDAFVKFHIQQGLVTFSLSVALWVIGTTFFFIWWAVNIVNLGVLVLAIIGIVNAINGKEQELPIVGKYGKYFKI